MQQLMARAQKIQARVNEAQRKLEKEEVTGSAGSGAVKIVLTLKGEMKSINIGKELMDPNDKEMLEDLIVAAYNDAKKQSDERYSNGIKEATGGLNIPGL